MSRASLFTAAVAGGSIATLCFCWTLRFLRKNTSGKEGFEVDRLASEEAEAKAFRFAELVSKEEAFQEMKVPMLVSEEAEAEEESFQEIKVAAVVSGEEEGDTFRDMKVTSLVSEVEEEEEAGVFEVAGLDSKKEEEALVATKVSVEEALEETKVALLISKEEHEVFEETKAAALVPKIEDEEAFEDIKVDALISESNEEEEEETAVAVVFEGTKVPVLVSKVGVEELAFEVTNVASSISEEKEEAALEEDGEEAFEEINVASVISEEEMVAFTEEIKAKEIAAENHEERGHEGSASTEHIDQHLLESSQLENLLLFSGQCGLSSKSAEHFAISNLALSDHEERAGEVINVAKENPDVLKESAIAHISRSMDSYPAWKRRNPFLMEQIKGLNMKARRIRASSSYSEVSSNVVTPVVPHVKYSIGSIGHDAQMKDIAVRRAKELREEEEERTQTQKTRCLAKLEELNNQTLALSSNESNQSSPSDCNSSSRSQLSRIESRYTVPNQQAGAPYRLKSTERSISAFKQRNYRSPPETPSHRFSMAVDTDLRSQTFHDRSGQRQSFTGIRQSSNGSWRESLGVSSDSSDMSFTRRPPVHPRPTSTRLWMEKRKP